MRKKTDLMRVKNEIVLARKIEDLNLQCTLELLHLDFLDVAVSYRFELGLLVVLVIGVCHLFAFVLVPGLGLVILAVVIVEFRFLFLLLVLVSLLV